MDHYTRTQLNDLNRRFYATTAQDFDATRQTPWPGWHILLDHLPSQRPLRVLDVGCGNARFGVFLAKQLDSALTYHGIDNSAALLAHAHSALTASGIAFTLAERDAIAEPLQLPQMFDLVVAFGVLHHVAGAVQRLDFLRQLAAITDAGGLLAFAAWRFYDDEKLRQRVVAWAALAEQGIALALDQLETGDYLLDWRRGERALRYCHFVDDAEHDALVSALSAQQMREAARYRADNNGNLYSVLRRAAAR
jgi:tRNA (uracil-5-)-methyltransferase TRM9